MKPSPFSRTSLDHAEDVVSTTAMTPSRKRPRRAVRGIAIAASSDATGEAHGRIDGKRGATRA
jgi:hypothetical protein